VSDSKADWSFKFPINARSFLERAKVRLSTFDEEGSAENLFYAALELRTGIEARLFEYIDGSRGAGNESSKHVKEYSATTLLAILARIDPKATEPTGLVFGVNGTQRGTLLEYTPVTRELARYHGTLGELLHFKFFRKNRSWLYRDRLEEEHGVRSLADWRDFLEMVVSELDSATRGALLAPPSFVDFIERVSREDGGDQASS